MQNAEIKSFQDTMDYIFTGKKIQSWKKAATLFLSMINFFIYFL